MKRDDDDLDGIPGEDAEWGELIPRPDPEWEELLAWAREPEDDFEWSAVIADAKQATAAKTADAVVEDDDADEWGRLLALAKAIPSAPPPAVPAAVPPAPPSGLPSALPPLRPPPRSIASLSARLERLAAQIPDARRRAR
jgi:hypothetical protein